MIDLIQFTNNRNIELHVITSNHNNNKLLPEYGNRNFFITILAHEMVHVYEAVYYDKMTHGPTFFAFREDFHKAGLELSGNAGYDEDDFV